jgi:hypothetical protein
VVGLLCLFAAPKRSTNADGEEAVGLEKLSKRFRSLTAGDPVPKTWMTLKHPSTADSRGEVEILIELVPKNLAKKRPVGLGTPRVQLLLLTTTSSAGF